MSERVEQQSTDWVIRLMKNLWAGRHGVAIHVCDGGDINVTFSSQPRIQVDRPGRTVTRVICTLLDLLGH